MPSSRPQLGRGLLLPGPLPPLSHLGVTVLRHVVATGLRYALYQLGLPLPQRPPFRIVRLRPYLDGDALVADLATTPDGGEIRAALLEPGGTATPAAAPAGWRTAARLHRARLRLRPVRPLRPAATPGPDRPPAELWEACRDRLTSLLPDLNEALLAELVVVLDRRARRRRGEEAPACDSREAGRLRAGRRARLCCLGTADPRTPSWAAESGAAERALERLGDRAVAPIDRLRGRFRERWRESLDELRRFYLPLAEAAVRRQWIERPDDAFFLPFDLAGDLASNRRPEWVPAAVAANRREHRAQQKLAPPPEALQGSEEPVPVLPEIGPDLSPLWPLL